MSEKFLRWASGIDNLKGTAVLSYILGMILFVFGVVLFFSLQVDNFWTKISAPAALWALGLMFIFEGSSILRDYLRNKKGIYLPPHEKESLFLFILKLFFVLGTILFFYKFYVSEGPSNYPIIILLLGLVLVIMFYKNISQIELSKNRILVKMKEDREKEDREIESKKNEWNFEIKGVEKK